MKRIIIISAVLCLFITATAYSQDMLKKVGKAVTNEILGSGNSSGSSSEKSDPEPSCACDDAEIIVSLGGSLKLDYKETNISIMDDGSILMQDKLSGNYYIVKDGATQGPFKAGDPKIAGFENGAEDSGNDQLLLRYKNYISKSGDKYLISFGGKTYGPYGQINSFAVTRAKDKFAALVVENVVATEMDGKAMDEAMKNAKSDQERMQLAMKFSQQMQQKIMSGGGPSSMTTKLVTNVPDATFDFMTQPGASPNGDMKYDDIMLATYNKIYNLQGKLIITLKNEHLGASNIFIKTDNTGYAIYNYGTIMFSDGKSLTDLFNPHLIKTGGMIYLAYMYFSPKRNAIVQCKIPF
ncbi:MAG: hypothetical protein NT092_10645 [Bacteroidia bacterium]|nr:hypothetical protein [Bacteroidia bacterium]